MEGKELVNDSGNNTEGETIKDNKLKYFDKLKKNALIAFVDRKGKPRTGKAIGKNSSTKLVKVVTEYGAEFTIPWSDVLWIKTGIRWPRGVYNLLKGVAKDEQRKEESK